MLLTKLIYWWFFFTLSVCECSTFSFVNGIFKIQKRESSLEACFIVKSCTQSFMTRICFYKLFLINECMNHNQFSITWYPSAQNKNTEYLNNNYANVIKFIKIISNSTYNRQKTQKIRKTKKTSFPKESVENADLYKPVLNKIMTAHK